MCLLNHTVINKCSIVLNAGTHATCISMLHACITENGLIMLTVLILIGILQLKLRHLFIFFGQAFNLN